MNEQCSVEAQASRLPEIPSIRDLKERLSRNRKEASALKRLIRLAGELNAESTTHNEGEVTTC